MNLVLVRRNHLVVNGIRKFASVALSTQEVPWLSTTPASGLEFTVFRRALAVHPDEFTGLVGARLRLHATISSSLGGGFGGPTFAVVMAKAGARVLVVA